MSKQSSFDKWWSSPDAMGEDEFVARLAWNAALEHAAALIIDGEGDDEFLTGSYQDDGRVITFPDLDAFAAAIRKSKTDG